MHFRANSTKTQSLGKTTVDNKAWIKAGSTFGATDLKNYKFHLQEHFWLHRTDPGSIHHSQQVW